MTVLRIGITGPIGCGKSTVAAWLRDEGALVIDADRVARDVLAAGSPELDAVVEAFGSKLIRDDGWLDRAALGRIVFRDPEALRRLEAITHPAVRRRILALFDLADAGQPHSRAVVVEAIKLVEGGLAALCDEVWLIRCDPADQRARLRGRGADEADAEARIAAQGDLESRLRPVATQVIDTTGPAAEARARVLDAWRTALENHRAGPKAGSGVADEGAD